MQPDTNATEPDSPRTWAVSSVIQIPTARERHGEKLKCVALHESYAAKSVAVEAKMDVKCEYKFSFFYLFFFVLQFSVLVLGLDG